MTKDLAQLKGIKNVKFSDALKIVKKHFGEPRITGSHHIFRMPWKGDPMVNIQPDKNKMAKSYQVRALIKALKKMEEENEKKAR